MPSQIANPLQVLKKLDIKFSTSQQTMCKDLTNKFASSKMVSSSSKKSQNPADVWSGDKIVCCCIMYFFKGFILIIRKSSKFFIDSKKNHFQDFFLGFEVIFVFCTQHRFIQHQIISLDWMPFKKWKINLKILK